MYPGLKFYALFPLAHCWRRRWAWFWLKIGTTFRPLAFRSIGTGMWTWELKHWGKSISVVDRESLDRLPGISTCRSVTTQLDLISSVAIGPVAVLSHVRRVLAGVSTPWASRIATPPSCSFLFGLIILSYRVIWHSIDRLTDRSPAPHSPKMPLEIFVPRRKSNNW